MLSLEGLFGLGLYISYYFQHIRCMANFKENVGKFIENIILLCWCCFKLFELSVFSQIQKQYQTWEEAQQVKTFETCRTDLKVDLI